MLVIFSLVSICTTAFANDGGIAAIKVDSIKMRETALVTGKEVTIKKIVSPRYTITINPVREEGIGDYFGDTDTFTPKSCK